MTYNYYEKILKNLFVFNQNHIDYSSKYAMIHL